MKKISIAFLLLSLSFISVAQPMRKIGLFVPLYLDSVFHGNDYRYVKKFPRYALQGLDFVQGAQIALDSFPVSNCIVELFVYDSKSDSVSVKTLIDSQKLDSLELIIGAIKDDELNLLASFAKSKKIPFISATYPNDGGIVSNPYYVILNSTLRSHCEAIFIGPSGVMSNNSLPPCSNKSCRHLPHGAK